MNIKPMLAKKYRPDKITFPCHIQPKLNGVRALWIPGHGLVSRETKVWLPSVLPHIHLALEGVDRHLDGELYCHGMSLQQINSRVAVKRVDPHPEHGRIGFHVFDYVALRPFHERTNILADVGYQPPIHPVVTMECWSLADIENAFKLWRGQGYEGAIVRVSDAPYGLPVNCGNKENRWNYIQKRKDWLDVKLRGQAVIEGEGKYSGTCGSVEFIYPPTGRVFTAGSGLTDSERVRLWDMKERFPEASPRFVVNYEMLSDIGKPLKPTIELVEW